MKVSRSLFITVATLVVVSTTSLWAEPVKKPNFVFLFCDNLGYGDVEPFGSKINRTPNLNRMAEEGRKFTDFYVSAGVCTPSRASFLTGCYPRRVNMHQSEPIPPDFWAKPRTTPTTPSSVLWPVSSKGLHPDELTIAEVLKDRGYATTCIGKWHLGDQKPFLPTRQGFDSFFGIPYSEGMMARTGSPGTIPPLPLLENEKVVEAPVDCNLLTQRYTERAIKYMTAHKDEPFFLYLAHAMPGSIPDAFSSPDFRGKNPHGPWSDKVEELDWSTGKILDAIRDLGIAERTFVIWTSDNGAGKIKEGERGTNLPLAGWGYTTAEAGHRVPCIMWWPGTIPAGTVCSEVATTMDLMPTYAGFAGGEEPRDRVIDGKDVRSLIVGEKGAESPHQAIFYYYMDQLQAVRSGDWKLYLPLEEKRTSPFRMTGETPGTLFNLRADLSETKNLFEQHPKIVERLTGYADKARADLGDLNREGAGQRSAGHHPNPTPRLLSSSVPLPPEQQIDLLIEKELAKQGQAPNNTIDDATFLRRVYLDLIGRIPTLEEAENFYAGDPVDRRSRLIDDSLVSDGYVRHFYHFWADLLRINKRLGINETPDDVEYAYRLWVKKALRENLPYDEFVRQLVTAEGHSWDNGAVGYYQRDRGMPLDNMSNTVRVFLGTRLECAQCHDHPFDHWTQMDYYHMAAFSYGMQSKGHSHANREALREHLEQEGVKAYRQATGVEAMPKFSKPNEIQRWVSLSKKKGDWQEQLREWSLTEEQFVAAAQRGVDALDKHTRKARQVINAEDSLHVRVRYVTTGEKSRTLQLPHDYQYKDAAPHDAVAARTMFGDPADASISEYGEWMTSKQNPTFTRVIANRLWKKVFGAALFEPVDEITDNTTIHHPELMAYLEQLLKDLDYDMKAYLSVLCKTKAYQRAATEQMPAAGEAYLFPGPVFRRMTAEQIWDSVIGQVLPEVDRYSPNLKRQLRAIRSRERIYDAIAEMPTEQYIAALIDFSETSNSNGAELAVIRKELPKAVAAKDADRVRELQERQTELMNGLGQGISRLQKNPQAELDDDALLASFGIAGKKIGRGSEAAPQDPGSHPQSAELWPMATTLSRPLFPRGPSVLDAGQEGEWRARAQTEYRAFLGLTLKWARASELPSPAPRGHFLRDFGQSDRVMIDNAANQASVPQALNLLNGPLAEALSNRFSVLGGRVHAAESPEERAALLVEGLLTRKASEQEIQWMLAEIESSGEKAALQNIAWASINTRQFLFVR